MCFLFDSSPDLRHFKVQGFCVLKYPAKGKKGLIILIPIIVTVTGKKSVFIE